MIYQRFLKIFTLILGGLFIVSSIHAQQAQKSPFEKYDPNARIKQGGNNKAITNSLILSPEQEMQVRDMIYQEILNQEKMRDTKKEAGLLEFDEDEILYLGENESLRGSAQDKYIIFNTSTNMYRYVDMEKYKKVVSQEDLKKAEMAENDKKIKGEQ
jgi:hypothetical protein